MPGLNTVFREATDRLARRLVSDGRAHRRIQVGPVSALFDVSDFTVKGQYFAHVPYEPGATRVVLDALEPGGIFVDVGANTGYFTVLAALRVGERGHVYAFEPNPAVRHHLQGQVEVNGLTASVTISDVALADCDTDAGRLFLSCREENSGLSSLDPAPDRLARGDLSLDATVPVRLRTFDTAEAVRGLCRIDLMKIDVEGAEERVLRGMRHTLERCRPIRIICETQPGGPAAKRLLDAGYRMTVVDEVRGGIPNLLFE